MFSLYVSETICKVQVMFPMFIKKLLIRSLMIMGKLEVWSKNVIIHFEY